MVNRGTCVWTTCWELLRGVERPGLKPATCRLPPCLRAAGELLREEVIDVRRVNSSWLRVQNILRFFLPEPDATVIITNCSLARGVPRKVHIIVCYRETRRLNGIFAVNIPAYQVIIVDFAILELCRRPCVRSAPLCIQRGSMGGPRWTTTPPNILVDGLH